VNRRLAVAVILAGLNSGSVGAFFFGKSLNNLLISLFCSIVVVLIALVDRHNVRVSERSHPRSKSILMGATPWLALGVSVVYLDQVNLGYLVPWTYLFAISAIIVSSALQISVVDETSSHVSILLSSIPLFLALNLIPVVTPPAALFGYDASANLASARLTLQFGWPISGLTASSADLYVNEFPSLPMFSAILSLISGNSILVIGRYVPMMLNLLSMALFYLVTLTLFGRKFIAGFSTLGYAGTSALIFDSWYVEQSFALPLALASLLCLVMYGKARSTRQMIPAILCAAAAIMAEDLTVAILVFLLFFIYACRLLERFRIADKQPLIVPHAWPIYVIMALAVAFWTYVAITAIRLFGSFALSAINLNFAGGLFRTNSTPTFQAALSSTFSYTIVATLSSIIIYTLLVYRQERSIPSISLLFFALFVAGISFLSAGVSRGYPLPWARASIFVLLALIPPFASSILRLRIPSKRVFAVIALILFLGVQLYSVAPDYYDRSLLHSNSYGQNKLYFLPTELAAVLWLEPENNVIGDQTIGELLNGFNPNVTLITNAQNVAVFRGNLSGIAGGTLFVFISDYLRSPSYKLLSYPVIPIVSSSTLRGLDTSPKLDKVYANSAASTYSFN
jgi:hypothetical protein